MDGISLALAVVSLFSTCLDVLEKYDDWKDFKDESTVLAARFNLTKLRLKQWGQAVGFDGQKLLDVHHKGLDDTQTLLIIKKHLSVINTVFGNKKPSLQSRRERLNWALRNKARQFSQVEQFGLLVEDLHDLVPPNEDSGADYKQPDGYFARGSTSDSDFGRVLAKIEQEIEAETRREVHKWLLGGQSPDESYARLTKERVDGTCNWILDRDFFNDWSSSDFQDGPAKLLWVNGPAGFGKSFLCARVFAHLSSTLNTPMACFLFSSDFTTRSDPFAAIRSWISQVMSHPSAYGLVQQRWASQSLPTAERTDIVSLLGEIAQAIPECTFILDGLDECTWLEENHRANQHDTLAGFLEAVFEAIKDSKTRLMVVSRDEPEIRQSLTKHDGWFVEHKISPDDVRPDITAYARAMVNNKLAKKTETTRSSLSQRMADRCNGQFLWLKFQEDSLRPGKNPKQLERVIDETPTQLEGVYKRNWIKISQLPEYDRARAYSLLRWVAFAIRPLTVGEITEAVLIDDDCDDFPVDELPDDIDDDYIDTEIIGLCGSLLEIRSSVSDTCPRSRTIHLPHFSVKQYLLRIFSADVKAQSLSNGLKPSTEAAINDMLARFCLRYVNFERIWQETSEIKQQETMGSFRHYAAGSWHKHITLKDSVDPEIQDLINILFELNNPNWHSWRKWFDQKTVKSESTECEEEVVPDTAIVCYATRLELTATIDFLITRRKYDVNEKNLYGRTALWVASKSGNLKIVSMLLNNGADPNAVDKDQRTPLFMASWHGHDNVVKQLLENGAALHATDNEGTTPLQTASWNGHMNVVKQLLEHGADSNSLGCNGCTPLYEASSGGWTDITKLLLEKGADTTIKDNDGCTPLHAASARGWVELGKLLLEAGADINIADKYGWTPLHEASSPGHAEICKLLLEQKAEIVTDHSDRTPLYLASENGHAEVVKLLLANGANAATARENGLTPVSIASSNGHVEIIKLLLDTNTNVNVPDDHGWFPIMFASEKGHSEVIKLLLQNDAGINSTNKTGYTSLSIASRHGRLEAVKLLLENGADITIASIDGWTSVHKASTWGHDKVIQLLLQSGADISVPDKHGSTPVNIAAFHGQYEVVKLLIENGVNINMTDNNGESPIYSASDNGHAEVIRILLENDADIEMAHNDGCTPVSIASWNGHVEAVRVLLENDANINATENTGWAPLHLASMAGHNDVVQLLLQSPEVDIDIRDRCDRTPLFYAAQEGHVEVAELLLSRNASVSVPDRYHATPIFAAVRNGHQVMAEHLIALPESQVNAPDGLGRTLLWWAERCGCKKIVDLVCQHLEQEGVETSAIELSIGHPAASSKLDRYCDICTRQLLSGSFYYKCETCYDFDICLECFEMNGRCLDSCHEWAFCQPDGPEDG